MKGNWGHYFTSPSADGTTIWRSHPSVRESLAVCRARVACSQTVYFLFKVLRAQVIEYKLQGFIDRQRKAPRSFSSACFARRCFRKNEKNYKTTSVYRLEQGKYLHFSDILPEYWSGPGNWTHDLPLCALQTELTLRRLNTQRRRRRPAEPNLWLVFPQRI